jgi:O-antigen ligase
VSISTSARADAAVGREWLFAIVLLGGCVATAAAAVAGDGNIVVAATPVVVALLLGAIWRVPLRIPLLALIFLGLGVDATGEGSWNSPLAPLGHLLNHNLNQTVSVQALVVPLMTLALGFLLIVHLCRRLSLSSFDEVRRTGFATPMRLALAASLLTVVLECANGYRLGGDLQMAKIQVQDYVLVLLMAYLLAESLRGTRDYRVLGAVILAAAFTKSLIALWAYYSIYPRPFVATVHGDSILFACAAIMLIARFAHRPIRRHALLALVFLPVLFAAMVANNRRIVWVEVAGSLGTLVFISWRTPLRRLLLRSVLVALPLVLGYVAVGWNSNSTVFAPVKSLRTVGDTDDGSTLFRDLENYNLLYTLRMNPFLGSGFGQPFNELVTTPDISFFKEYRYMPHNSVLGLWGFTGLLGFTGLSAAMVMGVLLAARSYYRARLPDERTAAFTAIAMVLIYLIQCYGDIGFSERESIFLVGSALAVGGQLALTTGAWSAQPAPAVVMSGRR